MVSMMSKISGNLRDGQDCWGSGKLEMRLPRAIRPVCGLDDCCPSIERFAEALIRQVNNLVDPKAAFSVHREERQLVSGYESPVGDQQSLLIENALRCFPGWLTVGPSIIYQVKAIPFLQSSRSFPWRRADLRIRCRRVDGVVEAWR